jgi:hypothetical protein
MPAPRRNPLLLALALPLVPAVALAVILGTRHTTTASRPAATASPSAAPTPTPRPTPAPMASLLVPDRFDLGTPRAFGRIDVVGFDHRSNVDVKSYSLSAAPPAFPSMLPVWKLRGFAPGADTKTLLARIGADPRATPNIPGTDQGWRLDAANAQLSAGISDDDVLVATNRAVTDDSTAMATAARVLRDLGLLPQNAGASATSWEARTTTWDVEYARHAIDGVPVGFGSFTDTIASVQIDSMGNVSRLLFDEPSVDGGAAYPLRDWREAWSEVSRGRWFDECCMVNTGGGGPAHPIAFRATRVSLAYEQVGNGASMLVPMYVFADSAAQLSFALPALRLTDLAEPGGFKLTEPGRG